VPKKPLKGEAKCFALLLYTLLTVLLTTELALEGGLSGEARRWFSEGFFLKSPSRESISEYQITIETVEKDEFANRALPQKLHF